EGPCTYEVESTAGGYLALGKLTARVGARGEGRGASEGRVANQKSPSSLILHPSSFIPHPSSLILHPSSLFSVRTPTAIITDLGTEFGVEVDEAGVTESHVFQGKVEVRLTGGGREARTIQLGANESARVQPDKDAKDRLVIVRGAADPAGFVRVGQLASLAEERQPKPFRRWRAFSEELRKRDDLLAYYDFQPDESDRLVLRNRAATGRQFDGRISDAPWVSGRFPGKYALRFGWRGSGVHVNIPVECRQLALVAWVKLDYLPSARAGQYLSGLLLSDGWGQPTGQVHWQITQEGAMVFNIRGNVHATGPPPGSSGGLRQDQWHFVAVTRDLATGKTGIYLDGDLVGEQVLAVPDSAVIKLGGATIGNWDDPNTSPDRQRQLRGRMEELMVFRAALSPTEIHRLFELQQPEHTREQR
ncbi:MAG: hypothetical protein K8R46_05270, partial [Pirellulales bacterium]|nr:hypothetical protein [Pirellulales bacterium]